MSLRLSPKHGVNPTVPACAWCGESKNEVALLGQLRGDLEAPRNAVFDYEPCEACREQMDRGVTLIEITTSPNADGQMALNATRRDPDPVNAFYPTGRWCVIRTEAVLRMFTEDVRAGIEAHRKAVIDVETFERLRLATPPMEA